MLKTFGTRLVLASAAIGLIVPAAASANDRWQDHHPRRVEVNKRLENLNDRIGAERREGDLTAAQARQLRRDDRSIRREERQMARLNGSHLTKAEQRALNQQENAVSRKIGK